MNNSRFEMAKVIYQESSKVCMHYEVLRRKGMSFFWIVQSAMIFGLFSDNIEFNDVHIVLLSLIAIFVAILTHHNDVRLIGYYGVYINRIKGIEKDYDLKLYSEATEEVNQITGTKGNSFLFRLFPTIFALLWSINICYIAINKVL